MNKKSEVSYKQYMNLDNLYTKLLVKNARMFDKDIDSHNQIIALKKQIASLRKTVDILKKKGKK